MLDKNKIITPHLGEFHKIFPNVKKNINNIDKVLSAVKLIKSNIILKGPSTVIASHDKKIVINNHASSELAVIGSGDVLSGLDCQFSWPKKNESFFSWMCGNLVTWRYCKTL